MKLNSSNANEEINAISDEKIFIWPSVDVIIPTFNDTKRLMVCLDALLHQTYNRDLIKIIVVNNNEKDSFISNGNDFVVIKENKPGSYAARNKGISYTCGEIVAFTDSDCIPDNKWLEKGIAELIRTDKDRIAGRIVLFPKYETPNWIECYEKAFGFNQARSVSRGGGVTANLFVRRSVFGKVGVFDDSYFSGGDSEWNKRATAAGYSIGYAADAVVMHPCRRSVHELNKKTRRVAGAKLSRRQVRTYINWRTFVPPVILLKRINHIEDLSKYDKFRAMMVCYYLKIYRAYFEILLKTNITNLER
ncbi:glycosyltransferase [Fodinicurvata sp. EGI_FJ10296]|uniref:glycosyltransferase n=1 Tax=Fodinicurvata sp. EGI_FJ10296 TaxID=3231908 RepID=UPI00345229DC